MNPLEQLKSILCDPKGKCCIAGSNEDRAIVDRALAALAQPEQEPVAQQQPTSPDVRDALLFCLWHHQGGSSKIGQPIRHALGIGKYERMNDEQLEAAKRVQTALIPPPQRKPLPEKSFHLLAAKHGFQLFAGEDFKNLMAFGRSIETAHNIKDQP